jgi:low affinity Fe/Cu permease
MTAHNARYKQGVYMRNKKQDQDIFTRFTSSISLILGRPWIFATAIAVLIAWGLSGPLLGFSDTWQLIINTSTTIITFLMVFIIQNTQNRDNLAMNIKLDTIMEKLHINDDDLMEAEDKSDKKLEAEIKTIQHKSEKKSSTQRRERKK